MASEVTETNGITRHLLKHHWDQQRSKIAVLNTPNLALTHHRLHFDVDGQQIIFHNTLIKVRRVVHHFLGRF